jgi:hypothetical protein
MYWRMSPAALWPTVYGHLTVSRQLHQMAASGLKRQAAVVASEAAALAGMIADRRDRRLDVAMYLALAAEYADEAGDGQLRARALTATRSLYSVTLTDDQHANPDRALNLLDEAVTVAGPGASPLLRTWIHASRAEDHAALGHDADSKRDLDYGHRVLAEAPGGDGGFFDHWDNTRLAGYVGNCAVLLGAADDAIPTLELAAERTSQSLLGPHAAVLTDLATAYAQRNEVDRACHILAEVLQLCERPGQPERANRVVRARYRWLAGKSDAAAVRKLDEQLASFH